MNVLNLELYSLDEFKDFLTTLRPEIGLYGGRQYKRDNDDTEFKLNDIVRTFEMIVKNPSSTGDDKKTRSVIKEIKNLDQGAQNLLEEMDLCIQIATFVRQFFGNLFFDRNQVLHEIQFPKQKLATSVGNYRLLPLEGEVGSVECRIRGISANFIPTLSDNGIAEFFSRSIPRLRNLVAVRGHEEGARMVGPCDYFGNLESPYEYEYTVRIDDGIPVFLQHKKEMPNIQIEAMEDQIPLPLPPMTELQAEWITGDASDQIYKINENILGESLFKRKGILKIAGGTAFELNQFDATAVDLSSFKARLVKNSTPFQISNKIISPVDDYRVVSYLYEPEYANEQVKNGGGLFLENHSFPQTITPLDKNSVGFVTLAKWTDENTREDLKVIAVEIPFGYTLIVEEYCIHGDMNLDGMFMMCMTSSHASMQTADTVFLKNSENLENISLSIKADDRKFYNREKRTRTALPPIVHFKK